MKDEFIYYADGIIRPYYRGSLHHFPGGCEFLFWRESDLGPQSFLKPWLVFLFYFGIHYFAVGWFLLAARSGETWGI